MTSGTSVDEFRIAPERERAFQELLKGARQLHGWSQTQAEEESEKRGIKLNQTLISQIERGPYAGMRFWDVSKICRLYGIPVSQVLDALGWSDAAPESRSDRRVTLICEAIRDLPEGELDTILSVVEKFIVGSRHTHE